MIATQAANINGRRCGIEMPALVQAEVHKWQRS